MKILFFGDIVGRIGRKAVIKILPLLRKKLKPDLVLANAENIAHGLGITKKTLGELEKAGIDVFTSGNHVWKKKEILEIFGDPKFSQVVLRPANYPADNPGLGACLVKVGKNSLLVVNLEGRVFMKENLDCPFRKIDEILIRSEFKKNNGIIVDVHAEATSEKVALGSYLDGRVSAVLGTHTHIGTVDEKILPQGTAYITDIGMVGAKDSVIGVDKKNVIQAFLTQTPQVFEIPEKGKVVVNAIYLEINPKTKKTIKIKRIDLETAI